ncbi:Uma2 family endonuclease [Nocardiopsis mangrovi]|uniref:Uma2 family endonuclease n=1 Tax=Nocardiopsis mangrovi TaxID=1179818 RepID=A0ABV9E1F1_9ACTN
MTRATREQPLTVDEVEDMECHCELVNGRLDIYPTPDIAHSKVVARLACHLETVVTPDQEPLVRPVIVLDPQRTHFRRPDAVVMGRNTLPSDYITVPPLLAVEVVSPESVLRDNHTKRHEYADFGVESYWIITPSLDKTALIELRLENGAYREITQVYGEEVFETDFPFPVKIVPQWLIAGGPWKARIGGE